MEETGTDFLKIGLILASFPLWGPFAKALFQELETALRPEGGLFGAAPGPRRRREIESEIEREEISQVHEPLAHRRGRSAHQPGAQGRAQRAPGAARPMASGPQAGGGTSSFRSRAGSQAPPPRNRFR